MDRFYSHPATDKILELPDGVHDGIRKMHERWNNRLKFESVNIAKDYADGRLCFLIKFRPQTDSQAHNCDAPVGSHSKTAILKRSHFYAVTSDNAHERNRSDSCNGRQDSVFVNCIQGIESIKPFTGATFVYAQSDKESLRIGAGCFYSLTTGFVINPIVASGQFEVTILCTSIPADQFPCRMVKSGTKIVDGIADDKSKNGWQWLVETDINGSIPAIRIVADRKRVGIFYDKSVKDGLQIADVMFGSFNL